MASQEPDEVTMDPVEIDGADDESVPVLQVNNQDYEMKVAK